MKNTIQQLSTYLLLPIVVGVAIYYFTTRAVPDVRYTLSEKIPVTFADPTSTVPETVQQLEIKNIGNAPANEVVVKIDGQLTAYSIEKYSAADNVRVFDNQQPFEIVYPELPPQAGFRIVFKSPDNGLDYANLEISHNTGVAHEALAQTRRGFATWLYWGGFAIYMILSIWALRNNMLGFWRTGSYNSNPKQILQRKKPWYIFDNEWSQVQADLLKERLTKDYTWARQDIQKSFAYQLLSIEIPENNQGSEHKETIGLAIDILEEAYTSAINSAYKESKVIELLRVVKPISFPSGKWSDLEKRANEKYVALKKDDTSYGSRFIRALQEEEKPIEVSPSAWNELTTYWRRRYGEHLLTELVRSSAPLEFVQDTDISLLSDSDRTSWQWHVSELHDVDEQKKKHHELSGLLKSLLENKPIGETKPSLIEDREWKRLKEIESLMKKLLDAETIAQQNEAETLEIESEKIKVSSMREKLEKQLQFIHELLLDPTVIDRVEEYDDTFASGNWENLQKVARALKKSKR